MSPKHKLISKVLITALGAVFIFSHTSRISSPTVHRDRKLISSMDGDDPTVPTVAWLLAYPRAGATYTSILIQESTETATATNYGTITMTKGRIQNKNVFSSIPLYQQSPNGPYYYGDEFDAPTCHGDEPCHVLTRTQCGGFCSIDCPKYYLIGPFDFFKDCLFGTRFQNGQETLVEYEFSLVKKVVQLLRNPFDVISSRHKHSVTEKGETAFAKKYPSTKEGFQAFCEGQNTEQWFFASTTYLKSFGLVEVAKDVPCYAELYRWMQWHNSAFFIQKSHLQDIPLLVLHFEDLVKDTYPTPNLDNWTEEAHPTLVKLYGFLGLVKLNLPTMYPSGVYEDYYTDLQKKKILWFVHTLASPELWSQIGRYFEDITA